MGTALSRSQKIAVAAVLLVVVRGQAQTATPLPSADGKPQQRSSRSAIKTPATSRFLTPGKIAEQTFPSVVLVVVNDSDGQPLALGSGFFVRPGVLATNLHVIEGASGGYVKVVGQKAKSTINGTVAVDAQHDLALLSVAGATAPSLDLGDSGQVVVGDEIFAVGNPRGLEGTFSQGIVSSIRRTDPDTLLQITAPISPGSSGGPVLDRSGKVVGVAEGTIKEGQNLNFAIPAAYLTSLIGKIGAVQSFAANTRTTDRPSFLGGRNTKGVIGAEWRWEPPCPGCSILPSEGAFTFSLRNQLKEDVKNVYCLVIFHDKEKKPVDVDIVSYDGIIPAGLAKRVGGKVDASVVDFGKFAEFRILDFEIVE